MQLVVFPVQNHVLALCILADLFVCFGLFKYYSKVAQESVFVRLHAVVFMGASLIAIQIALLQSLIGPLQVGLHAGNALTWYQLLGFGAMGPVWHFIATGRVKALIDPRSPKAVNE